VPVSFAAEEKEMGYSEVLAPLVDELVKLYTEGFTMTQRNL